jgi:predicted phosphodiesterase
MSSAALGFRKDAYPQVILKKLKWCLDYAREERLLPALLGDLFEFPRDNANWLLGELLLLLARQEVIGIYGNHDVHENQIGDDDSLSVLAKGGVIRLLDNGRPWEGTMCGRRVVIGGTAWGHYLPPCYEENGGNGGRALVLWMAHHDVRVPGYEEQGRFGAKELGGISLVVNGHIHRRLIEHRVGGTLWITPGNISRTKRGEASREHVPAALRVDVGADGAGGTEGWAHQWVVVPHEPFESVFHSGVEAEEAEGAMESVFVQGLAELVERRTETGAGLMEFIEKNVGTFEPAVAEEILALAKEVTVHGH